MDTIGALLKSLVDAIATLIPSIVTPDWAALIRLLPLFVLPLVALWLLTTGGMWSLVGVTKRGGRITLATEPPTPAQRDANGAALFPPGRPYDVATGLIYPAGSSRSADGAALLLACPSCGAVRLAELVACAGCGLEMRYRTAVKVERPKGPPPGGAARA